MNNDKNESKERPLRAVAIKYLAEDSAPKVTAKGSGFVAERIIERAKEHGVKTHKDARLVDELTKIDVGENIPPSLYEVVAQILIFIDDLDKLAQRLKVERQNYGGNE